MPGNILDRALDDPAELFLLHIPVLDAGQKIKDKQLHLLQTFHIGQDQLDVFLVFNCRMLAVQAWICPVQREKQGGHECADLLSGTINIFLQLLKQCTEPILNLFRRL